MNHYSDSNLLDGTLRLLAGKEENDRIRYDANICLLIAFERNILDVNTFLIVRPIVLCRAASDIKGHVEAAARELSLERFANFESELYQVITTII
jgi:hypothetical protein